MTEIERLNDAARRGYGALMRADAHVKALGRAEVAGCQVLGVKLGMVRDLLAVAAGSADEREAGNTLQVVLEELPAMLRLLDRMAVPADGPLRLSFEEVGRLATAGVADGEYRELWTEVRP